MAFDLHVFTDRNGKPCVSVTDSNNVRSKPIRINSVVGRYLLKAAIDARNAGRADGKTVEGPCHDD